MNIIEKFLDLLKLESTREMERAKKDFPNDFVCDRQAVDQANPDFKKIFLISQTRSRYYRLKSFGKHMNKIILIECIEELPLMK